MDYLRQMICILLILVLCISLASAADALSTTQEGNLQAIAQSPTSIALYWRHQGQEAPVYVNGELAGTIQPDPEKPFARMMFDSLSPSAIYSFTVGEDGKTVTEHTWSKLPDSAQYDVLVIGGTASGVASAISAARLGLDVALVENTNRLGGMFANGLGATDIRNIARGSGIYEDFRRRVIDFYGGGDGRKFEPRVANAIIKSMVYDYPNIDVYLRSEAVDPIVQGNDVQGAVVRSLISGETGRITAGVTIDATDTADFAAAAGAEYRVGREPRTPEEPHAGVIYFDDSTQTILPGSTGKGDEKMQSYAYLMIWKDYGEEGAPLIEEPPYYDPETYRYSPEWRNTWNYTSGRLPNDEYEINQHPFGIDWPSINHDYPSASPERRREIEEMYKARALGYLYFMQNERGHKNLGLADDEFLDNDNFPVSLYIREARRVMGEYLVKEADITFSPKYGRENSIGIGDYPMDSHATEDLEDPTVRHKGEGEMWLVDFTPWYQIPYGVIVPKEIDGLLISQAVSGTHVGYGTLRMEPVRFALGQAAGATAYWAAQHGVSPRSLNPAWLQDKLLAQDAYVTWYSDVNRATRHFGAIQFLGTRGVFTDEKFRPNDPLTNLELATYLDRILNLQGAPEWEPGKIESPRELVTRGEFAQALASAMAQVDPSWQPVTPSIPSYSDVPKESPYFAAAETLLAHRIDAALFEDTPEGAFLPDASISRADAAEALYLAYRPHAMGF